MQTQNENSNLHFELIDPETALFTHKIKGLVTLFYENEKPLQGLVGKIDWFFHGDVSRFIRKGVLTGKEGECVYFPIQRPGHTYHLILLGAGSNPEPGSRKRIPPKCIEVLKRNLKTLRLSRIGLSLSDFGSLTEPQLKKNFEGTPIWITH